MKKAIILAGAVMAVGNLAFAVCLPGQECNSSSSSSSIGACLSGATGGQCDPLANINVPKDAVTIKNPDGSSTIKTELKIGESIVSKELTIGASKTSLNVQIDGKPSTKVDIDAQAKVSYLDDGGIKTEFLPAPYMSTTLVVNKDGSSAINISQEKSSEVQKINLPGGANVVSKDGELIAKNSFSVASGQKIDVQIKAVPNKPMEAEVSSDDGKTYHIASYPGSVETEFSYANSSILGGLQYFGTANYDALISKFSSSRSFVVSYKRGLEGQIGKDITITPISSTTRAEIPAFEEVLTFDGKRAIKLSSGDAKVSVNGVEQNMESNRFFGLPSLKITPKEALQNSTGVIDGYYIFYGSDSNTEPFNWAYIHKSGAVFKFNPQDSEGFVQWKELNIPASVAQNGTKIVFGNSNGGEIEKLLSNKTYDVSGYYLYYGEPKGSDLYYWAYVDSKSKLTFNFGPQDANGVVQWTSVNINAYVSSDGTKVNFK